MVVTGEADLVPADDVPDAVKHRLPRHHGETFYGRVMPLLMEGTAIEFTS